MLEKDFNGKMRDNLKLDLLKRVENELEPGWPDIFYMNNGFPGWIESKVEEKFPNKIDFEPGQAPWLSTYWNKGGYCYVALHVQANNFIYIWAGRDAVRLGQSGGTKIIEPLIAVRMNQEGWLAIYELFRSEPIYLRKNP